MKSTGIIFLIITLISACSDEPLEAPEPPAYVKATPDDWQQYQKKREAEKSRYLTENKMEYAWFSNFAFSETDGIPYIILRLLPILAPEIWGSVDNPLEVVGLFKDERQKGFPIARGFGISGFSRKEKYGNIDYSSFTCGACHIGRVIGKNNEIKYIDGGVNAEFNVPQYLGKLYQTIQKIVGDETDAGKKQTLVISAILTALDETHKKDKTYFYQNYQAPGFIMDAEYERLQIELFKKSASQTIPKFVKRSENEVLGYIALLDKNYKGFKKESLAGFPGMADATGIATVHGYLAAKENFFLKYFADFLLPPVPGLTDFLSVWEQNKRKARWDENEETLIHGGGQWNGDIPIPIYRNLAAQLTVGLENTDVRVSALAADFLDELPATVYPFDVDVVLAKKGESLFAKNCAQCHQPHNGKVYPEINTDLERTKVLNWLLRLGAIWNFNNTCSSTTEVEISGATVKPCAEFDGVSLEGKKSLIISPNEQHYGYSARPLSGVWAQAPYLHNGSVPTIYHLLVPSERPDKFAKSRLSYDQKYLGFSWRLDGENVEKSNHEYVLDTNSFYTLSNNGHDKNIEYDDGVYQLDWSKDKESAMAIVEYLKTL